MHAIVLLVAVTVSGYASISRALPETARLRLGVVNAEGLAIGQGGDVGDIRLGRLGTIIKPVDIPTAPVASHSATVYSVKPGETLDQVAQRFSLSADDIRWSNAALTSTDVISGGQALLIPPLDGVVVTVGAGDTVQAIADRYHVDVAGVIDYNYLRSPDALAPGTQLVIPGGRGPDLFPRRVSFEPPRVGSFPNSKFYYGYCTWYVASRRPVPWTGDAWEWFGAAQAMGYQTGQVPQPGAIMVTWESYVGHVAYVEAVNADGSFVVSEMNYRGWGMIDERTLHVKDVPLIGFIY